MFYRTSNDICLFDTETSELNFGTSKIIEIAAIKLSRETGERLGTFHALLNHPDLKGLPQMVTKITGITVNDLRRDGRDPVEVMTEFFEFTGECVIGAHKMEFDLGQVRAQCRKLDVYPEHSPVKFCSMDLALRLLSPHDLEPLTIGLTPAGAPKGMYQLGTLAKYYGVSDEGAHRADQDTDMLWDVFHNLYCGFEEMYPGDDDVLFDDWMQRHHQIELMPWGKHWGKKWEDIPVQGYGGLLGAQGYMDLPIANSIRVFLGKDPVERSW